MKKRFLSLLLAVVMIITVFPMAAFAESVNDLGQVHVIVENTTFTSDTAPWKGTLVDKMIDLSADSTMMTCIKQAVESENYSITIDDTQYGPYISAINGLAQMNEDAGQGSGWMGTLNDWFTNLGFGNFKVSDGSLKAGDEIRIMFTCDGGADIGGDFDTTNDTSLAALSFSDGKLNTEFAKDTLNYTLTVPSDVSEITVDASAANKNNQVYLSVGETEYSRTDSIPVTNGMVLKVRCGDASGEGEDAVTPTTYTITVVTSDGSESVPVIFNGMHEAQVASLKVYSFENGVKGDKNLLDGVELAGGSSYNTALKPGDYLIEGYDKSGSLNGTIVVTVTKDGNNTFTVRRVYEIYVNNSGWIEGTDYKVEMTITGADKTERQVTFGKTVNYGNERTTCLFLDKDTVAARFIPIGDKAADYFETTVEKSGNQTTSNIGISTTIPKAISVTIKAPAGSTISAGRFSDYYKYTFADSTVTTDEDGVTAVFRMAELQGNIYNFYRVQNPNGITYWQFAQWKTDANITVTADDLKMNSDEIKKDSIFRYTKNVYDRADIYLNINAQGYKNMSVGETFELNVFRNWMAIENYTNARVALPDMHYSVIDINGNPSDVLTITPDENNSSVANMKANKAGTAIVLVTYDSMIHMQGQSSTSSKEFSAIWPECTGVFIVTVGNDGSAIKTNMLIDRIDSKATDIDAEHDILFYLDNSGAEYSFVPESGATVKVARSTVTDKMTFGGFTSDGVTIDSETGEVTVSGLTTGRHIIKVEKGGKANYQVVTARQVSYKILDANGKELSDTSTIKAGDKIKLQFSDFVNPAEKLSGAYNFNASIYYKGEDGTTFKSNPGTPFGGYDFSGKPERQLVEVSIPKYWAGDTFTLHGAIKMGGFGNTTVGGHRGITYATGMQPNFNAPQAKMVLSVAPEVTINLAETDFLDCKFIFKDDAGNEIDPTGINVTLSDTKNNPVIVNSDGTFKALDGDFNFVTNATGYDYKTGSIKITESDRTFEIVLDRADKNSWDGLTTSEPAKDESGVYLVSTGAELAWIAKNSATLKTFSAKLTADIDLAKYPWTAIDASKGKVEFDGDGHKIIKMNGTKGLFDTIGYDSIVKNLTIGGTVNATTAAGGIAMYLQKGTIENCINEVVINASSGNNIGGIAGYMHSGSHIKNCANVADITAKSENVGGIVGDNMAADSAVTGCYNTGYIVGTKNVGGIVGIDENGGKIANCYNHGKVRGTSAVGGIIGSAKATDVSSCYNVGLVTGGNQFVGEGNGVKVTRGYYLRTLGTDEYAEALSDNLIKSADLDKSAFGATCTGYPALLWQTDVTFHKPSTAIVIKPLCDEKGYTAYLCENCGYGYQANYTDPIGHDWCDTVGEDLNCKDCEYFAPTCTEEGYILRTCRRDGCAAVKKDMIPATGHVPGDDLKVYPAHRTYTCAVCGEHIELWNDERLKNVTLPETGVADVTLTDGNKYAWIFNDTDKRFESTNKGVNSGRSEMTMKFTLYYGGTLAFNYSVSSEKNYDKLTITLTDANGNVIKIANGISGENSQNYSGELEAGEYGLYIAYVKDNSGNTGSDMATVSDIVIASKEATEDDKTAADAVIAKINDIGEVTDLAKEESINGIKAAYDALTPGQKALVTNASVLETALKKIAVIKAKPAVTIDFDNEKLANLVVGTTYKITSEGLTNKVFTAESTTCDIRADWFGKTISIVALVEGETYSDAQELAIPERPAALSDFTVTPASFDADDGKITFKSEGVEYSTDKETWTAVSGTEISELEAGTYYVRQAATDSSFAGDIVTVTVEKEEKPLVTGWVLDGSDYYYYDAEGNLATGWAQIDGAWYYLDSAKDGKMATGWAQINGKWYYFNQWGKMITGWAQISGKWYYFNASGAMVTGWAQISGKWYYFNASGAMVTGWAQVSGKWYYFNASGAMLTGWQSIGGKWYYFNTSGAMLTGTQKINGKTYKFNSSGVWVA